MVFRLLVFTPRHKPAGLPVVVVITQGHLGSDQQYLSELYYDFVLEFGIFILHPLTSSSLNFFIFFFSFLSFFLFFFFSFVTSRDLQSITKT